MEQNPTTITDIADLMLARSIIDRLLERAAPVGPLSGLTLTSAIETVVQAADHPMSAAEIHTALVAGAFRAKSKHLRVEIYGLAASMVARGTLRKVQRGGRKFFTIPTSTQQKGVADEIIKVGSGQIPLLAPDVVP